jgi:hypothetical protein
MAYELVFWKDAGAQASPADVYRALCEDLEAPGLEALDPAPMLELVASSFPGCERHELPDGGEVLWESPSEPRRGFQLAWDTRHIHVRCQRLSLDEINFLVDAALAIDCPLYDPQIDQRFDGRVPPVDPSAAERRNELGTPRAASVDAYGWVTCPRCSRRFKTSDPSVFADSVHLKCSQRLVLRLPEK